MATRPAVVPDRSTSHSAGMTGRRGTDYLRTATVGMAKTRSGGLGFGAARYGNVREARIVAPSTPSLTRGPRLALAAPDGGEQGPEESP